LTLFERGETPRTAYNRTYKERSTAELVLYTTFLLLLLQLCSKWWIMREIRQPRDVAGLRGELVEGGG